MTCSVIATSSQPRLHGFRYGLLREHISFAPSSHDCDFRNVLLAQVMVLSRSRRNVHI